MTTNKQVDNAKLDSVDNIDDTNSKIDNDFDSLNNENKKKSKKIKLPNTKEITITAVLVAFSIVITTFVPTVQVIPGYVTITIGIHTPILLAMFISPFAAAFTSLGALLGFFLKGLGGQPALMLRAASHIIFAIIGSLLVKRGLKPNSAKNLIILNFVVALIHAIGEVIACAIALLIFKIDMSIFYIFVLVGSVTIGHSTLDYTIAYFIYAPLKRAKLLPARSM